MSFRRGFEEFTLPDAFQNKANLSLKVNSEGPVCLEAWHKRLDEELENLGFSLCLVTWQAVRHTKNHKFTGPQLPHETGIIKPPYWVVFRPSPNLEKPR